MTKNIRQFTKEHKKNLSLAHLGKEPGNKGKTKIDFPKLSNSGVKKGTNKGEKSYLWKGGLTLLDHVERTKFHNTMQKLIFERDNYTCQLCGIRGVDLQVDHIQSWAKYVELRFSVDNCRTLCVKCHYKITFGKPVPENIKTWGLNFRDRNKYYGN